ncbi:MAG: hypothetical protein KJ792_16360 [Actinobacteria bacterium]|nr:hypothetical protein [Actinomycetota bacterium]
MNNNNVIADDTYPLFSAFESSMRNTAAEYFAKKGYEVDKKYPFILADREDWEKNIILPPVAERIKKTKDMKEADGKPFPLSKYIHHGLSSQPMLFNLVGPLVVSNDLDPLRLALESVGAEWPEGDVEALFEVEDRDVFNEQTPQPTSIDLVVRPTHGVGGLFIEAKLMEKEFGGCSVFARGDCDGRNPALRPTLCYLHRNGRTYWHHMHEHGFLAGTLGTSAFCPLANYYQFYREVLFAIHKNGQFILLYDDRSPVFACEGPDGPQGLFPLLHSLLPDHLQDKVFQVTVQEVFKKVCESGANDDWTAEFAEKYAIPKS